MTRSRIYIAIVAIALPAMLTLMAAARPSRLTVDGRTSDRLATAETKATLRKLAHYSMSPEAGILSGQNVGYTGDDLSVSYRNMWTKLRLRGCPEPALMAVDLATKLPESDRKLNLLFEDHVRNGGFVSIAMHPPNPWTGGDAWDKRQVSFKELTSRRSSAAKNYQQWLTGVADIIESLGERNVTVLWRPLHEANGDWFWWCYGGEQPSISPQQYKRLWKSMHRYFHVERKLRNVLWVYSPNAMTGDEVVRFDTGYPGRDSVDIVGLDYYGPDIAEIDKRGSYEMLKSFGKVMALCEFGAKPWDGSLEAKPWLKNMRSRYPHFAYFCSWHSWPGASVALADLDEAPALMNNDFILTLDNLRTTTSVR